jgi:cobyrinic acid a,c-diamide synthase
LDLDLAIAQARTAAPPAVVTGLFPDRPVATRARIAMAHDRAFHFYYRDALDLLEAWGAELVPFSPLEAGAVPTGVGGLYLGGGYPELFARELAANASMLASVRDVHERGTLVYAECGGAMYVAAGIEDADGGRHAMAGLWPAWTSLRNRRLSVGYRRVRACPPGFLAGRELPTHEFHHSRVSGAGDRPAWLVLDQDGRPEGHSSPGLIASYIHVHLGSRPGLAACFVEACGR